MKNLFHFSYTFFPKVGIFSGRLIINLLNNSKGGNINWHPRCNRPIPFPVAKRSLSEPGRCSHASGSTKGTLCLARWVSQHPTPKCNPRNRPWRARQTGMEALASRCARACGAFHSGAVVRLANLAVTLHTSRRAGHRAALRRPRVAPRRRRVLQAVNGLTITRASRCAASRRRVHRLRAECARTRRRRWSCEG